MAFGAATICLDDDLVTRVTVGVLGTGGTDVEALLGGRTGGADGTSLSAAGTGTISLRPSLVQILMGTTVQVHYVTLDGPVLPTTTTLAGLGVTLDTVAFAPACGVPAEEVPTEEVPAEGEAPGDIGAKAPVDGEQPATSEPSTPVDQPADSEQAPDSEPGPAGQPATSEPAAPAEQPADSEQAPDSEPGPAEQPADSEPAPADQPSAPAEADQPVEQLLVDESVPADAALVP